LFLNLKNSNSFFLFIFLLFIMPSLFYFSLFPFPFSLFPFAFTLYPCCLFMNKNKKALIVGITGQDGAYLAQYLLSKGYEVFGTSRDAQLATMSNLKYLGIENRVKFFSMSLIDFRSVLQVVTEVKPDEMYNLAGQSSVGLSFGQPVETLESVTVGTLNILEVIRFTNHEIKFYNASSSECFGNIKGIADETTPFNPRSPYAAAKAAAFWITSNYREAYNIFACSGILFNHESPLRHRRFVTQKIISGVLEIKNGTRDKLTLGNINITRDWGWAPEYVEAMYLMMQQNIPDDFIIATGESHTLKEFVATAFNAVGLNWETYLEFDNSLLRPTDIEYSCGNASKAQKILGWEAKTRMSRVIERMIENGK
jgi:GDPmannose 4,6-dehydratase